MSTKPNIEMIKRIKACYSLLKPYQTVIGTQLFNELQMMENSIEDKVRSVQAENRVLRIGIVGEVKAGKSSFLNALLFKGNKVLPEAATPMTAALTRISYSEKPKAEVHFYSERDWKAIETLNDQYETEYERLKMEYIESRQNGSRNPFKTRVETASSPVEITEAEVVRYVNDHVSEQMKGGYELVQMVKQRGLFASDFFDRIASIDQVSDTEQLMNCLNEYVGANGKYTPFVKSTNLYLDMPELRGIEVIDTPGTNDPILSRGLATKNQLSECDVIFLLSSAGQFMKAQDIEFMMNLLPSEGISNGVIVGSKFDLAILDDNKSGDDFMKSYKVTRKKLQDYAEESIHRELAAHPEHKVLQNLKEKLPPEFISSMTYTMSKKERKDYDKNEKHLIELLERRYKGRAFDAEFLRRIGNIDELKKKQFIPTLEKKKEIIAARIGDLLEGQTRQYYTLLEKVKRNLEVNRDNLLKHDKKELEDKKELITKTMREAKSQITFVFEKNGINVESKIRELILDIEKGQSHYNTLEVKTNVSTRTHTERYGFFNLGRREVTTTTTTYIAQTNQVVGNITQYVNDINTKVLAHFNELMDVERIKHEIKAILVGMLDFSDGQFSEVEIMNSIDLALSQLMLTNIKINRGKYNEMILEQFSQSTVSNEEIHQLEAKQDAVLNQICQDIRYDMEKEIRSIRGHMTEQSNLFIENLISSMEKNLGEIIKQISSKEDYIKQYDACLLKIEEQLNMK